MTTFELALWWTLMLVALTASSCFSGVEVGCYTLNRVRLDLRAGRTSRPDRAAHVLKSELEQPDRLLAALLIGNNIVNYLGALAMTTLLETGGRTPGQVAVITTLVLTPVLFVFGEALPKELFRVEADSLTYRFARVLSGMRIVLTLTGVLPLARVMSRAIEVAAGLKAEHISDARQRVAALLKEGAGQGELSEAQVSLVDRALVFGRVRVSDEMVRWAKVRSVPLECSRVQAMRAIGSVSHARIPVVNKAGVVVGVLHQADLHTRPDQSVAQLMTPPVRVKAQTPARDALLAIRRARTGVAIVEDASGRPVGLVTIKDLIEPLTGEIADL